MFRKHRVFWHYSERLGRDELEYLECVTNNDFGNKIETTELRDRRNCKTSLHRTKSMSSHISLLGLDFKNTNLVTLEVLFYGENYLWSFDERSSDFYYCIICEEKCSELDRRTDEGLLTIHDKWWSIFDGILFSADFDNCNHNIKSYAHIRDSFGRMLCSL